MFKKISTEPLVHFLFAGFLLFVYFKSCNAPISSDNTIVINKEELLNFMQYQSKAFNRTIFEKKLAQASEEEKQQLLENYTKDEVLYRAAIDLGLDQNDFVIKRRIIQKMEFILDDFDASILTINEDSLRAFFVKQQHRYFEDARYSFTHIFFKNGSGPQARANAFLTDPANQRLLATESLPYGDRFLYHRNYTEKTISFLEGQFGSDFTKAMDKLNANTEQWQGPIPSEHGQHLVLLLAKNVAAVPELAAVRSMVEKDYLGYLKKQHKEKQVKKLMDQYEVKINL